MIVAVILISLFLIILIRSNAVSDCTALIYSDNELVKEINLSSINSEFTFELENPYHIIIAVKHGAIRYESSDCSDKSCVNAGWLNKSGDIAVCLPSRTYIKLVGRTAEVDGITG